MIRSKFSPAHRQYANEGYAYFNEAVTDVRHGNEDGQGGAKTTP